MLQANNMAADGNYGHEGYDDDTEYDASAAWRPANLAKSKGLIYNGNGLFEQALFELAKSL